MRILVVLIFVASTFLAHATERDRYKKILTALYEKKSEIKSHFNTRGVMFPKFALWLTPEFFLSANKVLLKDHLNLDEKEFAEYLNKYKNYKKQAVESYSDKYLKLKESFVETGNPCLCYFLDSTELLVWNHERIGDIPFLDSVQIVLIKKDNIDAWNSQPLPLKKYRNKYAVFTSKIINNYACAIIKPLTPTIQCYGMFHMLCSPPAPLIYFFEFGDNGQIKRTVKCRYDIYITEEQGACPKIDFESP